MSPNFTAEAQALLDIHNAVVRLHAAGKLEAHLPSGVVDGPTFVEYEGAVHTLVRLLGRIEMHEEYLGTEPAATSTVHGNAIRAALNYRIGEKQ